MRVEPNKNKKLLSRLAPQEIAAIAAIAGLELFFFVKIIFF